MRNLIAIALAVSLAGCAGGLECRVRRCAKVTYAGGPIAARPTADDGTRRLGMAASAVSSMGESRMRAADALRGRSTSGSHCTRSIGAYPAVTLCGDSYVTCSRLREEHVHLFGTTMTLCPF